MRWIIPLLLVSLGLLVWAALDPAFAAATQDQLAAGLGQRLAICDNKIAKSCGGKDAAACMAALKAAGIEPPGGWKPGKPVTETDLADLTDDVIEASKSDRLACSPPQAVDALANASAGLGLGVGVIVATAVAWGYYFPPSPTSGGGAGGVVISPFR